MGQRLARRERERGGRLYHQQRAEEAVEKWNHSLTKLRDPRDRFQVSGDLCRALCELGKSREALEHAGHQCGLATEIGEPAMLAEAHLNMALCNVRSCEFSKAVSYCRSAMQHQPEGGAITGYLHLCLGDAFMGLSELQKAWSNYMRAHAMAHNLADRVLEVQVHASMSHIYSALNDHDSAIACCHAAQQLSEDVGKQRVPPEVAGAVTRFRRRLATIIARPYRKIGRYNEAMDYCEDAMKVALLHGDRPVQAECLFSFADIHRKRCDMERAQPRYESAYSIMTEIADRLGQSRVLGGLAKVAATTGQHDKAIELNEKALAIAQKIGNKMEMLRCHARLQVLYDVKGDATLTHRHESVLRQLCDEMDLFCGVCDDVMGSTPEKVEPLQCGHFIHGRCVQHLARSTLGRSGRPRPCPACRRHASQNPLQAPDVMALT
ncbi:43 kDa receptor-associated protein of the synapse-like [Littorina saxatilis]|uniref:RING-type domain-containing protein n=1 Tax=Littorina saxatilis TaxID=31220 RepID=A0AAN9BN89_9CAEN